MGGGGMCLVFHTPGSAPDIVMYLSCVETLNGLVKPSECLMTTYVVTCLCLLVWLLN